MSRISGRERARIFGAPCQPRNLVTVDTPWAVRTRVHRLVVERFAAACRLAADTSSWVPRRIDSYACRVVRGSTATSLHAYGLAWDFFDRPLPEPVDVWGPGNTGDEAFRDAFRRCGFALGAEFRSRRDFPHIEWADARPVGEPRLAVRTTPADVPEPPVKPVTNERLGEATGVRISTWFTDIPALDRDGRGWVDVPYPIERVVSITGHGSSPPDDQYWPPVVVTAQPRGEVTRVTLAAQPGQHTGIWVKILESEGQ